MLLNRTVAIFVKFLARGMQSENNLSSGGAAQACVRALTAPLDHGLPGIGIWGWPWPRA